MDFSKRKDKFLQSRNPHLCWTALTGAGATPFRGSPCSLSALVATRSTRRSMPTRHCCRSSGKGSTAETWRKDDRGDAIAADEHSSEQDLPTRFFSPSHSLYPFSPLYSPVSHNLQQGVAAAACGGGRTHHTLCIQFLFLTSLCISRF